MDYKHYIFRNETGYDITEKADQLYDKFQEVLEKLEELKKVKVKNKERDMSVRKVFVHNNVALCLNVHQSGLFDHREINNF